MWSHVQKMLQSGSEKGANTTNPPVIPLRKSPTAFEGLDVGKTIRFSEECPLHPFTDDTATVIGVRLYRFGDDEIKSYQLKIGMAKHYFLTVAEDDQGQYLAMTRSLNTLEQDVWFGVDALGFFTEQSSAKSIRCKANMEVEGAWAAGRYTKTVDWVEGTMAPAESPRLAHTLHYNLLVNEAGDKALEIEHDETSGENRIFITVYRPIEDIAGIDVVIEQPQPIEQPIPHHNVIDVPLFLTSGTNDNQPAAAVHMAPVAPPPPPTPQPKQRPDFRRLDENESQQIHIARTPPELTESINPEGELPSFLLKRSDSYLTLDQVLPPEAERVRVNTAAALVLIEQAITKKVRVRDVLREMLGLESALSEEVIFEIPLSDQDYRTLAMRYKLRPDHRIEIRSRLEEELRTKLGGFSK